MLRNFPESVPNDADDNEEVAELVVTALGTSGTHYICWKTKLGEYKQRSHGLPTRLQEWLFPSDGTTRDFATLQVILLGHDAFRASDKNGEIRNDDVGELKQLRRALTFNGGSLSAPNQRRWSRGRDTEQNLERPRSSTLPATPSRESTIIRKQLIPLLSHSRAPSLDRSRLGPAVPVSIRRQGRTSPIRPRSIDTTTLHGELGVLKEQPTPRSTGTLPRTLELQHSIPEYWSYRRRDEVDIGQTQPAPAMYQRPKYADAGTQTEPEPEPKNLEPQVCKCHHIDHNNQRDSAVSFGLSTKSNTDSRRSSFDTPITRPDSGWFESGWASPPPMNANPIVMGRMQDYFRSTTYVLGAALHPQGMG
ncbi:hypothetical protein GQX73_g795 [Xylaria multiplex]|uniref:Uncharacterized protein n=1 Tax=Xylaria multiplex TaxID=323545 RepID=A0A7C8NDJ8_9PEZI|nr:hypothetical protein GQX73_g795 [Xylaria multiplex]